MTETKQIIIPESIHAYSYKGEPVPVVPRKGIKKDGICPSCGAWISVKVKGDRSTCPKCKVKIDVSDFELDEFRKTTTKDMREYGLFPSISRLATYGEMPIELSNWYKTRLTNHVMDCYRPDREEWMKAVNSGLSDLEEEYSRRGTQIHGWIQKFMEGNPDQMDATGLRCCHEIQHWETTLGITGAIREMSHCNPELGMGGTIDFASTSPRIIADYKTKHSATSFEAIKKGGRKPLWSAIKQIAGYGAISEQPDQAFVISIRVDEGHEDTGETLFIEITDDEMKDGLEAITANAKAWMADNKYFPTQMYQDGLCWDKQEILQGSRV